MNENLTMDEVRELIVAEEEKAQNTADSMDQQEKRKCFEKDYDFQKTLINEESFENVNEQKNSTLSLSADQFVKTTKLNSPILDIFAAVGLAVVFIELALYIM